jgi:hypothetical protein
MKMVRYSVCLLLLALLFSGGQALAIKASIDPSEIAVGSRPLALGRAYTGMANDVCSLFQNTAGITKIRDWQLTTMYSNLLQEVNYSLLGFGKSLSREALGMAFLKADISGSQLTTRDPVTGRIVPDGDGAIGYTSSVWFFSYAVDPEKYFSHPYFKKLSLGASLKIFNQALHGVPGHGEVQAAGTDVDLGVQYRPLPWLTVGGAGYNVLPQAMGGQLVWGSGITESIPASFKLGFGFKLLGAEGFRQYKNQDVFLAYDYEFAPSRGNRPGLHHLGMEWLPWQNIALRLGLDQDAVATAMDTTGVESNLTAGVGVAFLGVNLDYAYHTFGTLSDNNSHFFSISLGVEPPPPPVYVSPETIVYLQIKEPPKKSITFNPSVEVKGLVLLPKDVRTVRINTEEAAINSDNTFSSVVPLPRYGKEMIKVEGLSGTGRILESQTLKIARLVSFSDVDENHPQRIEVGSLAALDYVAGFPDGTFRPEGEITRAELCTMLMRIKSSFAPAQTGEAASIPAPLTALSFNDVPARHWAAAFIAQAVKDGVVKGYPDGTFRPKNNITRGEALSVVVRFAGLEEPFAIDEKPFPDLEMTHWAAKAIFVARKQGYLDYLAGKNFEVNRKITRGEVVKILGRVEQVAKRVKDLLD